MTVVDGSSVAKGMIGYVLDIYSSRPFGRSRIPYQTISSVVNDANASKKEGITEKVTLGQLIGLGNFVVCAGSGYLATKIDNAFKYVLGLISVCSGFGGLFAGGLGTFRKHQGEAEQIEVLDKHVDKSQVAAGKCDDIVYSLANEDKINRIVELAKTQGVTVNVYGPHGTGKTQKMRRLTEKLESSGVCKKAVIWDANKQIYTEGIGDQLRRTFLGGGETIAQRIERLVANALAHHKKTGEYVVLILDEAHELFAGHDLSSFFKQIQSLDRPSSVDPNDRPATINDYGEVLKKVKDIPGLKGVILIQASNTAGNPYEYLDRGFNFSMEVPRAGQEERVKIIKNTLTQALKEKGLEGITLINNDYETLAKLGTRDIYDSVRSVISHEPSEKNSQRFRNMDVLRSDVLVNLITTAVSALTSSDIKDTLISKLTESIKKEADEQASNITKWKDEYEQRLKFEGGRPRRKGSGS